MRKRKIKKIGGSLFIQLLKADTQDFGIIEGDVIDIEDLNLMVVSEKMDITHNNDYASNAEETSQEDKS